MVGQFSRYDADTIAHTDRMTQTEMDMYINRFQYNYPTTPYPYLYRGVLKKKKKSKIKNETSRILTNNVS